MEGGRSPNNFYIQGGCKGGSAAHPQLHPSVTRYAGLVTDHSTTTLPLFTVNGNSSHFNHTMQSRILPLLSVRIQSVVSHPHQSQSHSVPLSIPLEQEKETLRETDSGTDSLTHKLVINLYSGQWPSMISNSQTDHIKCNPKISSARLTMIDHSDKPVVPVMTGWQNGQ